MYSAAAIALRRCTATKADGSPCRAWAVWDDDRQLCVCHAGRHHRGSPLLTQRSWYQPKAARYEPCCCAAYQWLHRPGGGKCRWPEAPTSPSPIRAGTHRAYRRRPR